MKWPIKAVNISGSEIKQSFTAKNSPLTAEEPTSHQKLPALYSTAISNRMEPFLGSNIPRSAVHPPKILSCFQSPHPAKLLHLPWKPPNTVRTKFRPGPCVCVWIDILKELNTHKGFFSHPSCWDWWIPFGFGCSYTPQGTPCIADIPWASQGSCKAPRAPSRRDGTYVPNNMKHSGSGSQQENSHRSPGTTNMIFTPWQEFQVRDPPGWE